MDAAAVAGRAAARRAGGLRRAERRAGAALRRRRREARRRLDEARQDHLARARRAPRRPVAPGGEPAQDVHRDGGGPARRDHQAGGPAAQHAHARREAAREAHPHRARDDGDLRAARQPLRHLADQVGAGGSLVPLPAAGALQGDRQAHPVEAHGARALHRAGREDPEGRACERTASTPRSRAARSTSTPSRRRPTSTRPSTRASSRSTICSRCA